MKTFKLYRRAVLVLLAVGSVVVALAPLSAVAADNDVVTMMSAGKIERIIKSFSDVNNFKELEDGTYSFEISGLKVVIFNKGDTMQLYAGFEGEVTLSRINEWNKTKRFTRAYVSSKGGACLEDDLELTGGVTEKNVKEWMKTYVLCLKDFKKHLDE